MGVAPKRMPDWSAWEGELAGGEFPLERYLGGSERSAVFRTLINSGRAAIKFVPASHAQAAQLVERWNRVARLAHPHLVRIVKTGTCAMGDMSLAYLVTEYAEENLAAVIAERTLSAEETFEMLQPVADTLAYLHGRDLVHGNLKPSNILAVKDTVKISCDAVSAGDPAEDVSALARTIVQALTQRKETVPRKDNVDALPHPFQEIARNCLCVDPHLRWSSTEIVTWLRSWQQPSTTQPVPAEPVSGVAARKRRLGYYAAVFALILVAVIIGALVMRRAPAAAQSASVAQPSQRPVPPAPSSVPPQPHRDMPAAGGVTHQVIPDIPAKARSTVHGRPKVVVRVAVDPSGNVTDATVEHSGSRYFSRLALAAARHWQFIPAESAESREWVLRFEITQAGTKVISKEQTPLATKSRN